MKKLALIALIVFYALPGSHPEANSQPKSPEKSLKNTKESIVVCDESRTGAKVVYTKPDRSLKRPEVQMIAQFISLDSTNYYRFRIEIISRRALANSQKIFIKSSTGIHVFDAEEDNLKNDSRIVNEIINWGCDYESDCFKESYNYTFFLETTKEVFFKIISSGELKVIFSNMRTPEEHIAYSDIFKMNDLNTYLKTAQNKNLLNL